MDEINYLHVNNNDFGIIWIDFDPFVLSQIFLSGKI